MPIITTEDLGQHLVAGGIQGNTHDTTLTNAVNAAIEAVKRYCGREFDKTAEGSETARVFQPRSCTTVVCDDFWSTTNLVVKVDEDDDGVYETTLESTDFLLEPVNGREDGLPVPYRRVCATGSRLFPVHGRRPYSVQITAAWGWAAVPGAVKEAALIKAARLFHRASSPQGIAGSSDFGVIRISQREDPDVVMLLDPFRRPEAAVLVA